MTQMSYCLIYSWLHFFCKGGAALSAPGPVPAAGQPCWGLGKISHLGCCLPHRSTADTARAEPAAPWGSSDTTEEPQDCWFFGLCINHLSKIRKFWGMQHFLRAAQNWEAFPLTSPHAHIVRARGCSEKEIYNFRNTGLLPRKRWGYF